MRKLTAIAATVGATTALFGALSGTALADPSTPPNATDVVAVGSDTVQDLFAHFQQVSASLPNAIRDGVPGSKLYSFEATGSANITPKAGAASITRPNGSGAGINALLADIANGGSQDIDIARSSAARSGQDATKISFVAYARDAVAVTISDSTSGAPSNLTFAQLQAIYNCTATKWTDVGGTSTATIIPTLPQSSSGTRKFFLQALTGSQTPPNPGCWNATTPEENEGTNAVFANPNVIFPYSVGVALSQVIYGTASTGIGHLTQVPTIEGVFPATTDSSGQFVFNPALPSALQRNLYNVVRTQGGVAGTIESDLTGLLGTSGLICQFAGDIERSYGFTPLTGSACGAVS